MPFTRGLRDLLSVLHINVAMRFSDIGNRNALCVRAKYKECNYGSHLSGL
jgi:hypothetical protein